MAPLSYYASWACMVDLDVDTWDQKYLAATVEGFTPCFLLLTSPKATLTKKVNRSCKTGITQLLLLSAPLLKPIVISRWGWKPGICVRYRLRDRHRSLCWLKPGGWYVPPVPDRELERQQGSLVYLGLINHRGRESHPWCCGLGFERICICFHLN